MSPIVLVAGLDARGLPLEAPLLQRERIPLEQVADAREVVERASFPDVRVVVLGDAVGGTSAAEVARRLRANAETRHVSILVLLPLSAPSSVERECVQNGANAVLRRPLDPAALESWFAKLLAVGRRVRLRLPVQGQVVGTTKHTGVSFVGMLRNVSVNGLLLESPVALDMGRDLELEFLLPEDEVGPPVRVLGRVVRKADEVVWPHLGYGVEFLFVSDDALVALSEFVARGVERPQAAEDRPETRGIHATVRREHWVYEIVQPVERHETWQVEIRRAARDGWRAGSSGPFYVVDGATPEAALKAARDFLRRTPER
jgi:CheY-like chemotaxis protein